jgi:hypothetical protein
MDKTKNYVKLEDGSVEEIVDLSDLWNNISWIHWSQSKHT